MNDTVVPIGSKSKPKFCLAPHIEAVIKHLQENRDKVKSLVVVVGDGESFITWMGPNAQEANYAAEFAKAVLSRAMLAEYGLG